MSQHAPEVSHAAIATGVGAFGIVPKNGPSCIPADRRDKLFQRKFDLLSAKYLAEIRRTSMIEYR